MDLVPIKLISNKDVRNRLLKLKGETTDIDESDYIERRMNTNRAARYLMAIEDASEVAKQLLQGRGIFEQIGKDIKKESNFDFKSCFEFESIFMNTLLSDDITTKASSRNEVCVIFIELSGIRLL